MFSSYIAIFLYSHNRPTKLYLQCIKDSFMSYIVHYRIFHSFDFDRLFVILESTSHPLIFSRFFRLFVVTIHSTPHIGYVAVVSTNTCHKAVGGCTYFSGNNLSRQFNPSPMNVTCYQVQFPPPRLFGSCLPPLQFEPSRLRSIPEPPTLLG